MLRNLRTHIQRAEVQHGKLVSLRRAYNELLLGGGHWQKRYDASGNPFWKHTITKQIVYSDPQARFVQEVVPRNRHAEAMIKGRTHHRDTESPFDPPLSATASSIVHGPPPVTRQVSRDDVSAAQRAPELRAEVEALYGKISGKRKRKTRMDLKKYFDDEDSFGDVEAQDTSPQLKRRPQKKFVVVDASAGSTDQFVPKRMPPLVKMTESQLKRDSRYTKENGVWTPLWLVESEDSASSESEEESEEESYYRSASGRSSQKKKKKKRKRKKKKRKGK